MRIAIYVRKTSFDPTDRNPDDMGTQTKHIKEYVKKRGWRISSRFADKRLDPKESAGYAEMKQAALRRDFNCIIVDSIARFGPDVYQTIHFLKNTFYPAGLHFAVVEDDFCSMDHSEEEVYSYLEEKRAFVHGRMTALYTKEAAVESYFSAYGFRYDRAKHSVEIDEPSAKIIVEVCNRLKDGEKPISIARDMTSRGVETPGHYYYRQRGWRPKREDPAWTTNAIRAISKNPKYMGKWDCEYDVTKLDIRCGAIVEPELFEEVQEVYASRYDHDGGKKKPAPYINLIRDKESGRELKYFSCARKGQSDIRFRDRYEENPGYEKTCMSTDEFHAKVVQQMIREKEAAVRVLGIIESEPGRIKKEKEMQTVRDRFHLILAKATVLENKKMDAYRRFQSGEIEHDDYLLTESEVAVKLRELDKMIEGITSELEEIEQTYSARNPWIRLYTGLEEKDALQRKRIVNLVERILVYRFESVEVVPKEMKWKQALPEEWFREDDHGEKEQEE